MRLIPSVISTSSVIYKEELNGTKYYDYVILKYETGELQVFVGDTVALFFRGAKQEQPGSWSPWSAKEPWSAIQILSLFRDPNNKDNVYEMEFRWFWRCCELSPQRKKQFERIEDAFPSTKRALSQSVLESNSMGKDFVHNILGRVVLTSQEHAFDTWEKDVTVKQHNPTPVAGLFCQWYFDFLSPSKTFKKIHDWSANIKSQSHFEILILRGFPCLEESRRSPLLDYFMDNFEMRIRLNPQRNEDLKRNSKQYSSISPPKKKIKSEEGTTAISTQSSTGMRGTRKSSKGSSRSTTEKIKKENVYSPQKSVTRQSKEMDLDDGIESIGDPVYIEKNLRSKHFYRISFVSGDVFQIGDLIAVACNEAKISNTIDDTNKWKPFNQPWSPAQILSFKFDEKGRYIIIKWFSRIIELETELQKKIKKVCDAIADDTVFENELYDVFPISSILGYIEMSSRDTIPSRSETTAISANRFLPTGYVHCLHRIKDDEVILVDDWIHYDPSILGAALIRGLNNLLLKLKLSIIASIEKGSSITSVQSIDECYEGNSTSVAALSEDTSCNPIVEQKDILKKGSRFYGAVTLSVCAQDCVPRFVSKRHAEKYRIIIGDFVCVRSDSNRFPIPGFDTLDTQYPFRIPWTCCQILSIYEIPDEVHLEVKWFPRVLSFESQKTKELLYKGTDDEIFETSVILNDIPASHILGRVELMLGHHMSSGDPKLNCSLIPTVRLRCRQFYHRKYPHLQPLFCNDKSPRLWHQRLVERGIQASPTIQENELKPIIEFLTGICITSRSIFLHDLQSLEQKDSSKDYDLQSLFYRDSSKELLLMAQVSPSWQNFRNAEYICHLDDRKTLSWKIKVGDIIAASTVGMDFSLEFKRRTPPRYFPYCVEWRPCQVGGILRQSNKLTFSVRWFHCSTDFLNLDTVDYSVYEVLYETESIQTSLLYSESLLGPINLIPVHKISIPHYLPNSMLLFGGMAPIATISRDGNNITFQDMLDRSIQCCSFYDSQVDKVELLQKVTKGQLLEVDSAIEVPEDNFESFNSLDINRPILMTNGQQYEDLPSKKNSRKLNSGILPEKSQRISTSVVPFHINGSMNRAYFYEINVDPPFSHYVCHRKNPGNLWNVKIGDIVVLHNQHGAGRTFFDSSDMEQRPVHYPFKVPWGVAEIVAIWRTIEPGKEDELRTAKRQNGDLDLEIRWFWRKCELPGHTKSIESKRNMPSFCEEIFETDHIDHCTAESLLAPARIFSASHESYEPYFESGMPVLQFCCYRFWSVHRKSIVPFATDVDRKARSRMYSSCVANDGILKNALESLQTESPLTKELQESESFQCQPDRITWKQEFELVKAKLCLAQASSDACQAGIKLLGRQREVKIIEDFLTAAIKRLDTSSIDGSKSLSMFIAGPPGTGKTISVCSTIGKLRREQIEGNFPSFDFIALNGMEMRHPFEAYVKFWEALSSPRKERLSPELAAAKLERYFSGLSIAKIPKRKVIVLLLDELDYLVTKKETVLYNFFDWPKRCFEAEGCPRLVVIGISNTVDLPSKLKASVRSRLGNTRCDFKAYNVNDIVQILDNKIHTETKLQSVFESDAILFAARKVAAVSGDIRKAIQICKAAAEKVMLEVENGTRNDPKSACERPVVRIKDIQRVTRERMGNVSSQSVRILSPMEVLVMVSITSLARNRGNMLGGFDIIDVVTKVESIANALGESMYLPPPVFHEILEIVNRLADARLIRLHTEKSSANSFRASQGGSGGSWPTITPAVDGSDILPALRLGLHTKLAERYLGNSIF